MIISISLIALQILRKSQNCSTLTLRDYIRLVSKNAYEISYTAMKIETSDVNSVHMSSILRNLSKLKLQNKILDIFDHSFHFQGNFLPFWVGVSMLHSLRELLSSWINNLGTSMFVTENFVHVLYRVIYSLIWRICVRMYAENHRIWRNFPLSSINFISNFDDFTAYVPSTEWPHVNFFCTTILNGYLTPLIPFYLSKRFDFNERIVSEIDNLKKKSFYLQ